MLTFSLIWIFSNFHLLFPCITYIFLAFYSEPNIKLLSYPNKTINLCFFPPTGQAKDPDPRQPPPQSLPGAAAAQPAESHSCGQPQEPGPHPAHRQQHLQLRPPAGQPEQLLSVSRSRPGPRLCRARRGLRHHRRLARHRERRVGSQRSRKGTGTFHKNILKSDD